MITATFVLWAGWGNQLIAQARAPAASPVRVVTSVSAAVDLPNYQGGPCPAKLTFTGTIVADKTPSVPITYQWVRSDGVKGPVRTLKLNGKGAIVTDTWRVGVSGEMMRVWNELRVLKPNAMKSNQATAAVLCH